MPELLDDGQTSLESNQIYQCKFNFFLIFLIIFFALKLAQYNLFTWYCNWKLTSRQWTGSIMVMFSNLSKKISYKCSLVRWHCISVKMMSCRAWYVHAANKYKEPPLTDHSPQSNHHRAMAYYALTLPKYDWWKMNHKSQTAGHTKTQAKFHGIRKLHLAALCKLPNHRPLNTNMPNHCINIVIWQIRYACLSGL